MAPARHRIEWKSTGKATSGFDWSRAAPEQQGSELTGYGMAQCRGVSPSSGMERKDVASLRMGSDLNREVRRG